MKIDSGASSSTLDLTDLKVVDLDIDTGASSTEVNLPANAGNTRVDIDSGASSQSLHIPTGVAARIRVKSGIASVNVDSNRFPSLEGGLYQSADYATAANRARYHHRYRRRLGGNKVSIHPKIVENRILRV